MSEFVSQCVRGLVSGVSEVGERVITSKKKDAVRISVPWSVAVTSAASLKTTLTCRDFLLATPEEIAEELAWASTREDLVRDSEHADQEDVRGRAAINVLTVTELRWLREYRARWPRAIYMLSQSPFKMPNHSTTVVMQCQTASQTMLFSDEQGRWLTAFEMLSLQGFPVYPELSPSGARSSFAYSREARHLQPRNSARMVEQSGNSMPIPLISVPILWGLLFTSAGRPSAIERPLSSPSAAEKTRAALKRSLSDPCDSAGVSRLPGLTPLPQFGTDDCPQPKPKQEVTATHTALAEVLLERPRRPRTGL